MRNRSQNFTLALLFSTTLLSAGALWAQDTAPVADPPASPMVDEGGNAQPAQNPLQKEDDANPQPATTPEAQSDASQQDQTATSTPTVPLAAQAAPQEPQPVEADGKLLSRDASTLVVETSSGNRLRLTIDSDTTLPSELAAGDLVNVEYVTLNDGTLRATRVSIAKPKTAVAQAAAEKPQLPSMPATAKPKAAKPVDVAPAQQSTAVSEPAAPLPAAPLPVAPPPAASSAVVADQVASGASSETSAPVTPADHAANAAAASEPPASTSTSVRTSSAPWSARLLFPLLLLASGIAFIAVMGVRQARHAA